MFIFVENLKYNLYLIFYKMINNEKNFQKFKDRIWHTTRRKKVTKELNNDFRKFNFYSHS